MALRRRPRPDPDKSAKDETECTTNPNGRRCPSRRSRRAYQVPGYVSRARRAKLLYRREGFAKNTGQMPIAVSAGEITGTETYFHVDDLDDAVQRPTAAGARLLSLAAPREGVTWRLTSPTWTAT